MGHRKLTLLVAAVVCFGAVAWASEPPVGPWQSLNPSLEAETDAYGQTENTYPEEYTGEQIYYEDEPVEDDIPELPFKLPFKMDKKQVVVAMKLLKEAVKPILKSKTLRESLVYFNDAINGFNDDIETQLYIRLVLDSIQDIYEGKESGQIDMIFKNFFTQYTGVTDEATARTIDGAWEEYVRPVVDNYFYNPVRSYIDRVWGRMSDVYYAVSRFADRIDQYFDTPSTYSGLNDIDSDRTWYTKVRSFARRLAQVTTETSRALNAVSEVGSGARCSGCHEENTQALEPTIEEQ